MALERLEHFLNGRRQAREGIVDEAASEVPLSESEHASKGEPISVQTGPAKEADEKEDSLLPPLPPPPPSSSPAPPSVYVELGVASRREVTDIVADVIRERLPGWHSLLPTDEASSIRSTSTAKSDAMWNVLWSWGRPRLDHGALLASQRVNHIPNSRQLTRKDLLARHLDRFLLSAREQQPLLPPSLMPRTFALPQDYTAFVTCFTAAARSSSRAGRRRGTSTARPREVWIIKPVESSRGRGIRMVDDLASVLYTQPVRPCAAGID